MAHITIDNIPHHTTLKQDITDTTTLLVRAPSGLDLTGWTITGGVYNRQATEDDPTSNLIESFSVAGTTEFTLTLTPTQNESIGLGSSFWRVDGTDPSGVEFRLAHGDYVLEG